MACELKPFELDVLEVLVGGVANGALLSFGAKMRALLAGVDKIVFIEVTSSDAIQFYSLAYSFGRVSLF